jgi:hypothetical protein
MLIRPMLRTCGISLGALFALAACSADSSSPGGRGNASTAGMSGAGTGAGSGVAGLGFGSAGDNGGALAGSAATTDSGLDECAGVKARAQAELLPTDVIWAIDTSGSMNASFPAIQQALTTFSEKVVAAGIDAHIILLAGAGGSGVGSQGLCVPAPLGSGTCGAAVVAKGAAPDSKEPGFLHLDLPFGATAGMATLLDNHASYKHLLRPNARTQLVLTEDGAPPITAAAVTEHVEGRTAATATPAWSPGLLPGSYQWNGVVCKDGTGTGTCLLAFGLPQTTLDLIQQTMGQLGNLDDAGKAGAADPFAALLDKLAEAVIVGAKVSCDYEIPAVPVGQTFDRKLVNVVYASGANNRVVPRAPEGVECKDAVAWKYDNELTPTRVVLCPAACTLVQADLAAEVDVSFGCETELLTPE